MSIACAVFCILHVALCEYSTIHTETSTRKPISVYLRQIWLDPGFAHLSNLGRSLYAVPCMHVNNLTLAAVYGRFSRNTNKDIQLNHVRVKRIPCSDGG